MVKKAQATETNAKESRRQRTRERGTFFGSNTEVNTKRSKSQSCVLHQPCNTEAAAGLEAILLVLQVFPRAPKKVGVASVESMEPHWRLEDIMGSSLMGRLAFLENVFSSWGADAYEWQVTYTLKKRKKDKLCCIVW